MFNDGEPFISSDDFRINLCSLKISSQSFNILDVNPANIEDLTVWSWPSSENTVFSSKTVDTKEHSLQCQKTQLAKLFHHLMKLHLLFHLKDLHRLLPTRRPIHLQRKPGHLQKKTE